ncbi:MAG: hypothetical protein IJ774_05760 [Selenomonadaceae bacterium]|nr:hypothetical protein [Selenomonadaceae bacterium]MBR1805881.1 hypothetical protein [Selenomonadaceae bacterium]
MKKLLTAMLIVSFLLSGCGNEKTSDNPAPKTEQVAPAKIEQVTAETKPAPQLTGWEIITMPNHPRLADTVAAVRAFYQSVPATMVDIVDTGKDSPQAILLFQKEYADASVGRYEQKDFGEVNKIICRVSKTGKQMTFEEFKPILLSYFPVEIVRENFIYDRGVRFHNGTGTVIYAWKYKSNGENLYRGKPPYGGNLTVMVQEINGAVAAFGMFYGKDQCVPFMTSADGYEVENFDVDFSY